MTPFGACYFLLKGFITKYFISDNTDITVLFIEYSRIYLIVSNYMLSEKINKII